MYPSLIRTVMKKGISNSRDTNSKDISNLLQICVRLIQDFSSSNIRTINAKYKKDNDSRVTSLRTIF